MPGRCVIFFAIFIMAAVKIIETGIFYYSNYPGTYSHVFVTDIDIDTLD